MRACGTWDYAPHKEIVEVPIATAAGLAHLARLTPSARIYATYTAVVHHGAVIAFLWTIPRIFDTVLMILDTPHGELFSPGDCFAQLSCSERRN